MKIAFISPFYNIEKYIDELRDTFPDVEMVFNCDDLETMEQHAAERESEGFDAIISRGSTHTAINKFLTIPNINSEASVYDLIEVLDHVTKEHGKDNRVIKVLVYYLNTFLDDDEFVKRLEKLFDIKLDVLKFSSYQNFDEIWESQIKHEDIIVGAKHAMRFCQERGLTGYPLDASLTTLKNAVRRAIQLANARKNDIMQRKQLSLMLSYSSDGIIFMNNNGTVEMTNTTAKKIFKKVFGYYLEEGSKLRDNRILSTVSVVIEDRLPLEDQVYTFDGNAALLFNVRPIVFNNEVKDIIISFREAKDVISSGNRIRDELNKKGCNAKYSLDDIIGDSEAIRRCKYNAKRFGMFDSNVLIQGATGTGKELFAQAIHNCSKRRNHPFYGINCMSFPENLLESELFGYSEGSFTGAVKGGKAGLFELADGGTVFLDEIGEMPLSFQSKLLRVLQEKEIRRIGDDKVVHIDVRIIAASHRDLMEDVEEGNFREDLYYRLNVLNLIIPTLNERSQDIPLLLNQFINFYRSSFNQPDNIVFEQEAMNFLSSRLWRGNVRELQNFAERVCVYFDGDKPVNVEMARNILRGFGNTTQKVAQQEDLGNVVGNDSQAVLEDRVYHMILEAIEKFDGNKTKAANYLGVSRTYIWRKLKEPQN